MLILSRKNQEQIVIELPQGLGQIVLTVAAIHGEKVRLGVDAPKNIPVHRREIYEAIQRKGEAAA